MFVFAWFAMWGCDDSARLMWIREGCRLSSSLRILGNGMDQNWVN